MPIVAVVTGASAGVGRAIARELAARGARLGLVAREPERLDATLHEVRSRGSEAIAVSCDVADPDAVEDAADRVESELGPIDVWINDAMATIFAPLHEISAAEFRRATEVTYLGTVYGTMTALRRMRARNRGHIIQVGSALSYRGIPLQSAYCGAKHAIRGFSDSVRAELLHDRTAVFLTMAQLPALNTPQFSWSRSKMSQHPQPVPPIFQPEVAARAIADVVGHRRREVYVGWPTWKTVLGQKLVPGFVGFYLARRGYRAQQTPDFRYEPDRPDNLFEPVPGDWAAHGVFDDRAKDTSRQSLVSSWWTRVRSFFESLLSVSTPSRSLPAPEHGADRGALPEHAGS
jgi:short-subunit dehydrogenase